MLACGAATFVKRGETSYFLQAIMQKKIDRISQGAPEKEGLYY